VNTVEMQEIIRLGTLAYSNNKKMKENKAAPRVNFADGGVDSTGQHFVTKN